MFNLVHLVYFNCDESHKSAFELRCTHKNIDEQFFQYLLTEIQHEHPVIVINNKATIPKFWQNRLLKPLVEIEGVDWVSALSTEQHELSPINKTFNGSLEQLDQAVYLLQDAEYFISSTFNPNCFAVRNIERLKKQSPYYAVNNLVVGVPSANEQIKPPSFPETGDQRPLPAHALSELQMQLSQTNLSHFVEGYPLLDSKPTALHIVMDWGGGVHQWTNDFIQAHHEMNHLVLVSQGEFFRQQHGEKLLLLWQDCAGTELQQFHLTAPIKSTVVHHQQYQQLINQIVSKWQVKLMVVSSLIGHAMDCLRTGLPTLRVLHDYFPHWPSLNATLEQKNITVTQTKEALAHTVNEPLGLIGTEQLHQWQTTNNQLLSQNNVMLVAPDDSVKTNLLKLPHAECYQKITVIPHAISPLKPINFQANNKPFKVLVLGRISPPKGQELLLQCINSLSDDDSIQFVLMGAGVHGKDFKSLPNTEVIDDYNHDELTQQLADLSPQLGLLTSLTSETFSYTLSELQMSGIPVIATAVGAFKNRLIDQKNGYLVSPDAQEIVTKIRYLKSHSDELVSNHQTIINQPQTTLAENKEAYRKLWDITPLDEHAYRLQGQTLPSTMAQSLQFELKHSSSLKDHIKELQVTIQARETWAKNLNKENQHLTQNVELEKQENKHLTASINKQAQKYNQQISNLEQNIADVHGHLDKVNQELEKTIAARNHLTEQLHVSETNLEKTSDDLFNIKNSRSWRFTKPLRTLTTYLRDLRNAARYRLTQAKNLPRRIMASLKSRGIKQTALIAKNKLKKPQPEQQLSAQKITNSFQPLTIATNSNPTVSVVIPVYNQYQHTYHCLLSLSKLKDQTPFEVWVIDDCSDDETQEKIQLISGINYHRQQQNGGFIESCNTGASLATGEYLLFLNNDTEVLDGWLDELVQTFNTQTDAGLVGSQLLYPDGRLQEAGGIVFSDASGWNYGRLETPDNPEFQHLRKATYISGASIMIKKALFEQLGQFDRRYKPAYYEDTDLAFAVRKIGLSVYYQPLSKVIHFEGVSSGTDLTSGTKKYQVINQQKFLEKWQTELQSQPEAGSDIEVARFQNTPKRVLIFDACTPTPDQDSGSLRMINLMKIFIELGYQISFIPENMAHFKGYTHALQRLGVECIYAPKYNSPIDYLKAKGSYFQTIILSRYYVAEPVMSVIRSYCPAASIWFDTVDLHYLRETRMAELAHDTAALKEAAVTKEKELAVAQNCDLTLVVSPYEEEVLKGEKTGSDVAVLSNIHEVYGGHAGYAASQDLLFIGGYQHTPNVDGILWFVKDILPTICANLPDLKLHVVGSKAPPEVVDLGKHPNIEFHGFVEDIQPMMQNIRIAVAPLRFGAGVKGKVNMSMSYGQPVVGTKVAVEGMYTTDSKDVMMADDADDFATAVIKIYQDQGLWDQVSKGGLKNVEKWFSFTAAKNTIATLLQKY